MPTFYFQLLFLVIQRLWVREDRCTDNKIFLISCVWACLPLLSQQTTIIYLCFSRPRFTRVWLNNRLFYTKPIITVFRKNEIQQSWDKLSKIIINQPYQPHLKYISVILSEKFMRTLSFHYMSYKWHVILSM